MFKYTDLVMAVITAAFIIAILIHVCAAVAAEPPVAFGNYVADEDDDDHSMTVLICHDHALFAKTTAEYRDKKMPKEKVKKNIHELIKAHPETAMTPQDEAEMDNVVDWVYSKPLTTPPDIFKSFMKTCLHPNAT